jgi:hypothetical protein
MHVGMWNYRGEWSASRCASAIAPTRSIYG